MRFDEAPAVFTRTASLVAAATTIAVEQRIAETLQQAITKHAVQALTDTLRMELEREGANISVTLVKPAAIDTPFPEHARNFKGPTPAAGIFDPGVKRGIRRRGTPNAGRGNFGLTAALCGVEPNGFERDGMEK